MEIGNSILESIDILTKHEIDIAKFDKTIEAEIIKCLDEDKGYYRCSYMGAMINAYSLNLDIIYQKGNFVYILIPENDMSKNKVILGLINAGTAPDSTLPVTKTLEVTVIEDQKNLKFYKKNN